MGSARGISRPPSETTPEQDARARAWAYVFDCYFKNEAATSPRSRPDDGTRVKEDSADEHPNTPT